MPKRKMKYLPSMAAFQWGDLTVSPMSSGCLRNILFSSHGLREDIPEIYSKLGAVHEANHATRLCHQEGVHVIMPERPVKGEIAGTDQVTYSGRIDYIVILDNGVKEIHECKATMSKTSRREVIRKGNVKVNQLAQLVSYMIQEECPNGRLVVGYYEQDGDNFVQTESRDFVVTIDDEGKILVDGAPSGYRAQEQLAHMQKAAKVLITEEMPDRPMDYQQKYGSPCNYCPFKAACDKGAPTIEDAGQALEEHKKKPKKPVEINKYKPKKEKVK